MVPAREGGRERRIERHALHYTPRMPYPRLEDPPPIGPSGAHDGMTRVRSWDLQCYRSHQLACLILPLERNSIQLGFSLKLPATTKLLLSCAAVSTAVHVPIQQCHVTAITSLLLGHPFGGSHIKQPKCLQLSPRCHGNASCTPSRCPHFDPTWGEGAGPPPSPPSLTHLSCSCSTLSRSAKFMRAVSTASESPISAANCKCLAEKCRACL